MIVYEPCRRCNATGTRLVVLSAVNHAEPVQVTCDRCGGTGVVERVYWVKKEAKG